LRVHGNDLVAASGTVIGWLKGRNLGALHQPSTAVRAFGAALGPIHRPYAIIKTAMLP
jgi:Ser/Thr protein kinase RdoA (MazF antagonist)